MANYKPVKPIIYKKDWQSVEDIDYSLLLTHVFGKPIRAEQAFMYFFRRYGLPNIGHDDYKDLCAYCFHTNNKDVIVRWCMNSGDYHFHLCAFTNKNDWFNYNYKPINDYHKQIQEAAEKDGLVYFGGSAPYVNLWKIKGLDSDSETTFIGNDIQKTAIDKMSDEYEDKEYTEEEVNKIWDEIFDRMDKNDKDMREKYNNIPYPEFAKPYNESFYRNTHDRQVEAGKEQHDWILTLPEDHFLRRIYFAAKSLFEDWKRPTYIRDVYFNMTCEEQTSNIKRGTGYTDFTTQLKKVKDDD